MMTLSIYQLNKNVSIRDMLDVYSSGNILIEGEEQFNKIKQILLNRILENAAPPGEIHIRFSFKGNESLEDDLAFLEKLAAAGIPVTIWVSDEESARLQNRFNVVVVKPDLAIAGESFVITSFNDAGRTLVFWNTEYLKDKRSAKGVFVTDPEATAALLAKIHSVLET
jgi:hypothetical protein